MLARARTQNEARIADRFFAGDRTLWNWSSGQQPMPREPTLAWRVWLTSWPALERFSAQISDVKLAIVRFGSDVDVGELEVSGAVITARLQAWIRVDGDCVRVRVPNGAWSASLDVHDVKAPRIALWTMGPSSDQLLIDGDGTEPWKWGQLTENERAVVQGLKRLVASPDGALPKSICDRLTALGLGLDPLAPWTEPPVPVLTLRVSPRAASERAYAAIGRALSLEVPGIRLLRVPNQSK